MRFAEAFEILENEGKAIGRMPSDDDHIQLVKFKGEIRFWSAWQENDESWEEWQEDQDGCLYMTDINADDWEILED